MKKHIALMGAGLMVLGFQIAAQGADTNRPAQNNTTQRNQSDPTMSPNASPGDTQATPSERPAAAASDKTNRPQNAKDEEAYQAKLKQCNAMGEGVDKKACMDKAKKERGQM
ncbi:MAG TPA: hypothetical protein VHB46_04415 [Burkholderiales bacterium]|nr:hypothetical protein [Burkholderiales bacterium]